MVFSSYLGKNFLDLVISYLYESVSSCSSWNIRRGEVLNSSYNSGWCLSTNAEKHDQSLSFNFIAASKMSDVTAFCTTVLFKPDKDS